MLSAFLRGTGWYSILQKISHFLLKIKGCTYQSAEQEILNQRSSIWENLDLTDKQTSFPLGKGRG